MASDETRRYMAKYTKEERIRNWFAYNKWWLLLGIAVAAAVVWTVWRNVTQVRPDYQVAVVTGQQLPEDTAEAIAHAIAAFGADLNGDGRVVVQASVYPLAGESAAEDANALTVYETRLAADLMNGESCLFLLSDPDWFQQRYEALAMPDGSEAPEGDGDGLGKTFRWSACPALAGQDLGSWTEELLGNEISGDNAPLIEGLYLGRRVWSAKKPPKDKPAYDALWDALTAGAAR